MNVENLEENWEIFRKLSLKVGSGREEAITKLLDDCDQQILETPYRDRNDWLTSCPGGLVFHSLLTLKHAKGILKGVEWQIDPGSVALVCLFHDIGKIGVPKGPSYFLPQESSWHLERGQNYTYNPTIQKMTHPHRSLCTLQSYGVRLTDEEFVAILTAGGPGLDENRFYHGGETKLSTLLTVAQTLAIQDQKRAG